MYILTNYSLFIYFNYLGILRGGSTTFSTGYSKNKMPISRRSFFRKRFRDSLLDVKATHRRPPRPKTATANITPDLDFETRASPPQPKGAAPPLPVCAKSDSIAASTKTHVPPVQQEGASDETDPPDARVVAATFPSYSRQSAALPAHDNQTSPRQDIIRSTEMLGSFVDGACTARPTSTSRTPGGTPYLSTCFPRYKKRKYNNIREGRWGAKSVSTNSAPPIKKVKETSAMHKIDPRFLLNAVHGEYHMPSQK
jgi:hypothetical protein